MRFGFVQYMDMARFREELATLPCRMPLIIVSESGARRWQIDGLLQEMRQSGKGIWLSRVDANPTQYTVISALEALGDAAIDGILAVGGGSAMDLAKQVSAFYRMPLPNAETVLQAVKDKTYLQNCTNAVPITAVPTTAGTGSEVTQWATLWDGDSGKKYSVDAPWLLPETVWMVPELTLSLPAKLTLSAGLDAVCQAIEAYWAKASNPMSKELSLQAIAMITANLKSLLETPTNIILRETICTASLLVGLSFSQTRTTACHSLSYPLTARFGIEHGLAVALTLAPVAEINKQAVDLSAVEAMFAPYGGIRQWLDDVCGGIVTLRLSAFGVEEIDLDSIVSEAFTGGRMDNNPVELTQEMVRNILVRVL